MGNATTASGWALTKSSELFGLLNRPSEEFKWDAAIISFNYDVDKAIW